MYLVKPVRDAHKSQSNVNVGHINQISSSTYIVPPPIENECGLIQMLAIEQEMIAGTKGIQAFTMHTRFFVARCVCSS